MRGSNALAALSLLAVVACRGDPGIADYRTHVGVRDTSACPEGDFLPGPDPFQTGDVRIDLGIFYEGGSSEQLTLSEGRNYFIFESSYNQETTTERIEGCTSEAIILTGAPFWGGGIVYAEDQGAEAEDLSAFDTMRVSFLSRDASFADFEIAVQTEDAEFRIDVTEYGYANDGEWHNLEIPLADFTDDFTQIRAPFIFTAPGGDSGDMLLIDNFYYEVAAPN